MKAKWTKVVLRLVLGVAFLSAIADRFGFWPAEVSAWGNMDSFLAYTKTLAPWVPVALVNPLGWAISLLEVLLALALILGIKTQWAARISAVLLFIFAISMSLTTGLKGTLDYSVFSAAAAALALTLISEKYMELDQLWTKPQQLN